MKMRNTLLGFTLTELMVVVAIVGILAAIAFPSYQNSIRKARRADARAVLVELAQWLERNYTESYRYDQDSSGNAIVLPITKSPKDGGDTFYNIAAVTASGTFTLTATPANAQTDDECGNLTLNQAGQKGITGAHAGVSVDDCW